DIYVVIAKEQRRPDAFEQVQELRNRGYRVDYPLAADKVPKQFQTAENLGARITLLYGDEWPQVKVKNLATREESLIAGDALLDSVAKFFNISGSASPCTGRTIAIHFARATSARTPASPARSTFPAIMAASYLSICATGKE